MKLQFSLCRREETHESVVSRSSGRRSPGFFFHSDSNSQCSTLNENCFVVACSNMFFQNFLAKDPFLGATIDRLENVPFDEWIFDARHELKTTRK